MPDPDGSMLAWPQVPTLDCCLCLLLSMFHYTHSCASKSGMVHTHVGMPSQACVSISTKAQINSNQVCATNGCIRSPKLILRHVARATTTHQLQKCAQTDLLMWLMRVCPWSPHGNVWTRRPCAAAPERVTVRRAPPLHPPPSGGRRREEPGRGGVGVSDEGWAPHGKRRWGSMCSLGDSHVACK